MQNEFSQHDPCGSVLLPEQGELPNFIHFGEFHSHVLDNVLQAVPLFAAAQIFWYTDGASGFALQDGGNNDKGGDGGAMPRMLATTLAPHISFCSSVVSYLGGQRPG